MIDKTAVENEIKNLIPVESLKKPYQRDYENIWIPCLAEDIIESLPKGRTIAMVDNHILISAVEKDMPEGFEKFVHDTTRVYTGQKDSIKFSEYLEEKINSSHWKQLMQ